MAIDAGELDRLADRLSEFEHLVRGAPDSEAVEPAVAGLRAAALEIGRLRVRLVMAGQAVEDRRVGAWWPDPVRFVGEVMVRERWPVVGRTIVAWLDDPAPKLAGLVVAVESRGDGPGEWLWLSGRVERGGLVAQRLALLDERDALRTEADLARAVWWAMDGLHAALIGDLRSRGGG